MSDEEGSDLSEYILELMEQHEYGLIMFEFTKGVVEACVIGHEPKRLFRSEGMKKAENWARVQNALQEYEKRIRTQYWSDRREQGLRIDLTTERVVTTEK